MNECLFAKGSSGHLAVSAFDGHTGSRRGWRWWYSVLVSLVEFVVLGEQCDLNTVSSFHDMDITQPHGECKCK